MVLVGLMRVSANGQDTARQHGALDPICWVRADTFDALLKTGNPAHPHPPGRPLPMLGPKRYLT